MGIEVNASSAVCSRCGKSYGRRKGYFPVNYGSIYKGIGYMTVCKECIDTIYNSYLSQCKNAKDAVRQVCRKLDLYWNDAVYDKVDKTNTTHTMMTGYIAKINTVSYSGKSYDDTLSEEGTLWSWGNDTNIIDETSTISDKDSLDKNTTPSEDVEVPDDVVNFWGTGYTPSMYVELERRRTYWMSRFPEDTELDIGTEAIIRQICSLELDINRDRAAGRAVDKSINALNTLLGSASLKPTQKKSDDDAIATDATPFGVWIRRWENQRPIPEVDPELKDVDKLVRYIEVWFKGHLSKMLGIKNAYSRMYEEEISKIKVEHPEYESDDEETVFYDIFGEHDDE